MWSDSLPALKSSQWKCIRVSKQESHHYEVTPLGTWWLCNLLQTDGKWTGCRSTPVAYLYSQENTFVKTPINWEELLPYPPK